MRAPGPPWEAGQADPGPGAHPRLHQAGDAALQGQDLHGRGLALQVLAALNSSKPITIDLSSKK